MANTITWYEIPVCDFDRAKKLYETVLGTPLMPMEAPGRKMAAVPADWTKGEIAGCIAHDQNAKPSASGTVVFLNCAPDLAPMLSRVESAGGKVIQPKTEIPMQNAGFMALIQDSEGNSVGLHSPS